MESRVTKKDVTFKDASYKELISVTGENEDA